MDWCVFFNAIIGACTLAVTTLHSIPQGYLPAEINAKGPFSLSGTSWWWNIWDDALEFVLMGCVGRGKAGMTWNSEFARLFTYLFLLVCWGLLLLLVVVVAYGVGVENRSAIGVFLFATGSAMDRVLGESPGGSVLAMMGGGNGSADAVAMTMNGTGDAVMEDVVAKKSRRRVS